VARFGTRFKVVVVEAGRTVKMRVSPYPAVGTRPGTVAVTWKAGDASIATPVTGKTSGRVQWRTGKTATLAVKAVGVGRTTVTLTAPGTRPAVITVKVVPRSSGQQVRRVKLTGPAQTLAPGRSMTLKPVLTPAGAARVAGRWTSSNPGVATVDAVGRVRAKTSGRAVIVLKVAGKTAKYTVTVR
jgi:alpha-amylase